MSENNTIIQEIENDSKALLEELSLLSEDDGELKEPPVTDNKQMDSKKEMLKKKLILKGDKIVKNMQRQISDEDYIVNGFGYHSKILYSMSVKYPFLSKTIGVPLMAITKAITNNTIHRKMEQEKVLKVYTNLKGDKAAVDAKLDQLNKLQKPSKEQKEEIIMLKKMSDELSFNLKRLEYNFKLSHLEAEKEEKSSRNRRYYTT